MTKVLKITFVFILGLISSVYVKAQDDRLDDLDFEEIPIVEQRPDYFSLGAGYLGDFRFINFDEINNKLLEFNLSGFSGNMFISGAHGFAGIGIIPNIRLGFMGISGSSNINKDDAQYKIGSNLFLDVTAFSIDYGIVLFSHFAVLPGVKVGWSSLRQEIFKTNKERDWTDKTYTADNYFHTFEGSFLFAQPSLDLEYALTPFIMARLSGGYSFSFSPSWDYNSYSTLRNVPETINTSGLSLQFGIFVGLFNF